MKIKATLIILLLSSAAYAQVSQRQAWLFINHKQKLSKKFDLLADVQIRTADRYKYLNTLLLRGGLSYNFNKQQSAALGYTYKADWEIMDEGEKTYSPENRIYQQYLYTFKLQRTEVTLRARLEQRWVREENITNFSQRGRTFVSVQIPLAANTDFTRGWYTTLQNEIFFNLQNKALVNGQTFDQNRSFASAGFRFSKKLDVELGYQYWYQPEKDQSYRRNIIQLMVTSSLE